jgi:hypothetical protein
MATKSSRLGALKHLRKEISSMVNGSAIPLFVMAFLPVLFRNAGIIGTPYFFKRFLKKPFTPHDKKGETCD